MSYVERAEPEIDPRLEVSGVGVSRGRGHALFAQFVAERLARTVGETIPPPPPILPEAPADLHLKLTNDRVKCSG